MSGAADPLRRSVAGRSIFDKCRTYTVPDEIKAAGLCTYFRMSSRGRTRSS